jgi:Ca2+-binding RTX toxin-like protein
MFTFPSMSTYDSTNVVIRGTHGTSGADVLFGQDFAPRLYFSWREPWSYNDFLYGHGGADKLFGGAGDDYLSGGTEDDWLWGGEGADVLDGGSGFDWAMYDQATSGVWASLSTPSMNKGEAAGDTYIGIEGLVGSAFKDELFGDSQNNRLIGNGGDDGLDGGGGYDILYGGQGQDFLYGGAGNDVLYGGSDQDHFYFNLLDTWSSGFRIEDRDTIADFSTAGFDHDLIDLQGNGITYGHLSITDGIRGALVTISPFQSVIVQNVSAADLTVDMFLF